MVHLVTRKPELGLTSKFANCNLEVWPLDGEDIEAEVLRFARSSSVLGTRISIVEHQASDFQLTAEAREGLGLSQEYNAPSLAFRTTRVTTSILWSQLTTSLSPSPAQATARNASAIFIQPTCHADVRISLVNGAGTKTSTTPRIYLSESAQRELMEDESLALQQ
ncbi:hypothetical protein PM082_014906 [Marasmius tenuissimus]|nr:hypothetical protein PM082_014906 [Marasmius tenuissimus]